MAETDAKHLLTEQDSSKMTLKYTVVRGILSWTECFQVCITWPANCHVTIPGENAAAHGV